jgi:hypothetical protein
MQICCGNGCASCHCVRQHPYHHLLLQQQRLRCRPCCAKEICYGMLSAACQHGPCCQKQANQMHHAALQGMPNAKPICRAFPLLLRLLLPVRQIVRECGKGSGGRGIGCGCGSGGACGRGCG